MFGKKKGDEEKTTVVTSLTPSKEFKLPELPKEEKKAFYSYRPYADIPADQKVALFMMVILLLAMPIGLGLIGQQKTPSLSKASRDKSVKAENNTPSISTASLPIGTVGENYDATVSGFDLDIADNLTLIAKELPPGLSIQKCVESASELNASEEKIRRIECKISGVPERSGIFHLNFTLKDDADSIQKTIPLTIID